MVEQNARGSKVVIVSSFMGLTGFAGYSPYAPAKYALRGESLEWPVSLTAQRTLRSWLTPPLFAPLGLAECLRSEFLLYGIDVHLYLPAGILSPGLETENAFKPAITRKIEEGDTPITPEQCVEVLIKGEPILSPRAGWPRAYPGRISPLTKRLLPSPFLFCDSLAVGQASNVGNSKSATTSSPTLCAPEARPLRRGMA